ncbi:hypothetical protein CIG19_13420 [Enterobacterales bacterium CwR94]|nr:hypothetical protein CIG19_13420 [Enterobacterales bacterium CwR94]
MIVFVNGHEKPANAPLTRLERAVMISLFSWRRAEPDDISDERYGWWGDSWPSRENDRIGSRLWLLRRSTLTNHTAIKAREYLQQALNWMLEDGVVTHFEVQAERTGINTLGIKLTLWQQDGSYHNMTFDDIWSELNG